MIPYLIMIPVGYLIGAVPFGYLAGKMFANVDIREYGSGSTGMTNVLRTAGARVAAGVLLLDVGKSVLAVVIARLAFDSRGAEAAAALAVLFGHSWPVFIGFRGGRSTASGWGGLLILSPVAGLIATLIGLSLIALTRYMSVGSIFAASLGSLALVVLALTGIVETPLVYSWYGIVGGTLIVLRHKENILRLLNGTERKIGQPVDLAGGH
jgi:glycerol-3-phosphate acyltransferase PlsY